MKLAVIYYSATGHGTAMAGIVARAGEAAGAEVRLRHIAETVDPAAFAQNPAWTSNHEATKDLPAATGADIEWADAVIFGTPTRFGNVSGQFQSFIDSLGGLWAQGKLANKVYAGFTSSQTAHGGQEATPVQERAQEGSGDETRGRRGDEQHPGGRGPDVA